jgi:hypothetical protein
MFFVLPCGERSIRFRPSPDVTEPELEFGLILSTNSTNQARLDEVVADVAVFAR